MTEPSKDLDPERARLRDAELSEVPWRAWGPYVAARAWGTVREDYSPDGEAWSAFPHEHARSRAFRWSEDGMAGVCDEQQRLCLSLALWNGADPILKERMFGLTGPEGNHGEDVKEYWWYLDSTPTHSWMRWRYHYPQAEFPYEDLIATNAARSREEPEYELLDTGVFEDGYWQVTVDYAKADTEDLLMRVRVRNMGTEAKTLHVLPTLWFRNTWDWGDGGERPSLRVAGEAIEAEHPELGRRVLSWSGAPDPLCCENETNARRLFGVDGGTPYPKDGINDHVVSGAATVNPALEGTKAALWYREELAPGETAELRLRLAGASSDVGEDFDAVMALATDVAGNHEQPPAGNVPQAPTTVNLGAADGARHHAAELRHPARADRHRPRPTRCSPRPSRRCPTRRRPASRPSSQTVLQPFQAQSFATGIDQSDGTSARWPSPRRPTAASSSAAARRATSCSASRRTAARPATPLATLPYPIFNLAFDGEGHLWATTGGGPLLQLDPTTGAILNQFGDGITLALAVDPKTDQLYVSTAQGRRDLRPDDRHLHPVQPRPEPARRQPGVRPRRQPVGGHLARRAAGRPVRRPRPRPGHAHLRLGHRVDRLRPAGDAPGRPAVRLARRRAQHAAGHRRPDAQRADDGRRRPRCSRWRSPTAARAATTSWPRPTAACSSASRTRWTCSSRSCRPTVVAANPPPDSVAALPLAFLDVTFDQDMFVGPATDSSSVTDPANYTLVGSATGAATIQSVQYDPTTRTAC